ncbi:hypothetical protein AGRA3207_001371 [Actinomadura graeca]|uniref:DUF4297 domain-containing protein n=1 Tax=Actinomadura graeca TaxID=2750812 RepID=A0ABX8QPB6_9ACTN|nr:hypothetical protein [Actinomadura graeca]QXJ20623.1 hypothetical protein AGRA3207_001371 [Actinomadura graeca]
MTTSRAAGPAIKGYAYQFDRTIIAILDLGPSEMMTIEGCEDFDVHGQSEVEAVQCKYHEDTSFSLRGLRKPLIAMLRSFAEGKEYDYRLFVHYSDPDFVPDSLTVSEIKKALTEEKRKNPATLLHYTDFSESTIARFSRRIKITSGPSFDAQRELAMTALNKALSGAPKDAQDLHYGNALSCVMDLAIKKEAKERTISRASFIALIDKKDLLFTRWQEEILSQQQLVKAIQHKINRTDAFRPTRWRCLALTTETNSVENISDLAYFLATSQFADDSLVGAKPWTLIIDGGSEDVEQVKLALLREQIIFNDGYEHLSFSVETFNRQPVVNIERNHTKKIGLHSYSLRVLSAETYAKYGTDIEDIHILFSTGHLAEIGPPGKVKQKIHLPTAGPHEIKQIISRRKR